MQVTEILAGIGVVDVSIPLNLVAMVGAPLTNIFLQPLHRPFGLIPRHPERFSGAWFNGPPTRLNRFVTSVLAVAAGVALVTLLQVSL